MVNIILSWQKLYKPFFQKRPTKGGSCLKDQP